MVWIKTQRHVQQAIKALSEQSLRRREAPPRLRVQRPPGSHRACAKAGWPRHGLLCQSVAHFLKREPQNRRSSEQQGGQQCDRGSKSARMRIQAEPREMACWQPYLWEPDGRGASSCQRRRKVRRSAEEGKQKTFGDKLVHQPQWSCAQGASNGDLAPAALGAEEYEAGHIDACDQQEQAGPAEQRQEDRPHVADDHFGERNNARGQIAAGYAYCCWSCFSMAVISPAPPEW